MRWGALIWAAVLIAVAAAAVLAVEIAVAGIDKASGLAGVIVGFCELGAFTLGLAGWAGKRRVGSADRNASKSTDVAGSRIHAQMEAEASGHGRVYQAGRDMTINEK